MAPQVEPAIIEDKALYPNFGSGINDRLNLLIVMVEINRLPDIEGDGTRANIGWVVRACTQPSVVIVAQTI